MIADREEEVLPKIEYLIGELSQMMDSLENMNNTVTNNSPGFFTMSINNTNSNTYHLINSGNNINFNVTNISVNNSRLGNPSVSQNLHQTVLNRSSIPKQTTNAQNISDHNASPVNRSENIQTVTHFSLFLPNENSNNNSRS